MAPKKEKAQAPASKPTKSGGGKQKKKKWSKGKQKEKVNNAVLFDQASYDKMLIEVPKYKMITPSVLSDRLRSKDLGRQATPGSTGDNFAQDGQLFPRPHMNDHAALGCRQSSFEMWKKTTGGKKKGCVYGLGATTTAFDLGSTSSYRGSSADMVLSEQLETIKAELWAELEAKMKAEIEVIMEAQFFALLEKIERKLIKKYKGDVNGQEEGKGKRKWRIEKRVDDSDDTESDQWVIG